MKIKQIVTLCALIAVVPASIVCFKYALPYIYTTQTSSTAATDESTVQKETVQQDSRIVQTVWGPATVTSPMLIELLDSKPMQRIKKVEHLGPLAFFNLAPHSSRYDHCVGVMVLLQKAGESEIAQAAGLLHDASHTAFSHIADYLFKKINQDKAHQDDVHLEVLQKMGIGALAKKYGYSLEQFDPEIKEYKALECPLPDLCADRIQYNLQVAVKCKNLTQKQAKAMFDDVEFKDGNWYFKTQELARTFCDTAIYIVYSMYDHPFNCAFYHIFADALQRAIDIKLISHEMVQFSTDRKILYILKKSDDEYIKTSLRQCHHIYETFELTSYEEGDIKHKPRCRAFDPYILQANGSLKRLTELDPIYKANFEQCKTWCKNGYGIKLKNHTSPN